MYPVNCIKKFNGVLIGPDYTQLSAKSKSFSNHYLETLVKEKPEWKEDVTDAFNRAKNIYNSRTEWNRQGESILEEFLIRPILKNVLGHHFIPQAKVEQGSKRPDYAFFETETDLNEALKIMVSMTFT